MPMSDDVQRAAEAMHELMPGCTHDEHGADCVALAEAAVAGLAGLNDPRDDDIREKITAVRQMSCDHDVTSKCDYCHEVERSLRVELAKVYRDLLAGRGAIRTVMRAHQDCD